MRALLILIFLISFSAKILVIDNKDPGLNFIDAQLVESSKNPEKLNKVFQEFFGLAAKSKIENDTIMSVFFENVKEDDALLVLQKSQEIKVLKLHKASIMSGQSEKSYDLEIVYVAG